MNIKAYWNSYETTITNVKRAVVKTLYVFVSDHTHKLYFGLPWMKKFGNNFFLKKIYIYWTF